MKASDTPAAAGHIDGSSMRLPNVEELQKLDEQLQQKADRLVAEAEVIQQHLTDKEAIVTNAAGTLKQDFLDGVLRKIKAEKSHEQAIVRQLNLAIKLRKPGDFKHCSELLLKHFDDIGLAD